MSPPSTLTAYCSLRRILSWGLGVLQVGHVYTGNICTRVPLRDIFYARRRSSWDGDLTYFCVLIGQCDVAPLRRVSCFDASTNELPSNVIVDTCRFRKWHDLNYCGPLPLKRYNSTMINDSNEERHANVCFLPLPAMKVVTGCFSLLPASYEARTLIHDTTTAPHNST